jgi:hypothetical protein
MIKNAKNVYSIFFISFIFNDINSFIYSIDDYINIYISKVLYFSLKTI